MNFDTIYIGVEDNQRVALKFKQYSLSALAQRKERQMNATIDVNQMFGQSRILTSIEEASTLFYSIPGVSKAVSTHLLFSGGEAAIMSDFENPDVEMIQEAVKEIRSPTVFILKSGDYIFGGYASSPWEMTDEPFGTPRCFLFSLTLDLKIPYTGRARDLEAEAAAQAEGLQVPHEALMAGEGYIQFGAYGDLCFLGDMSECTSCLEQDYGLGLPAEGKEAKTLLAGSTTFAIDSIEIYEILGSSAVGAGRGGRNEQRR